MEAISTVAVAPYDAGEDNVIAQAIAILEGRMRKPGFAIQSLGAAKQYLRLHYGTKEHEEFNVLFLDWQNSLIANETMSKGTLSQAAVYPREVVKAALKHNAARVILAHNHPSGASEPSQADFDLTKVLSRALALVEIEVLDHFVVGSRNVYSFRENRDL